MSSAGVEPRVMGIGPVPAIRNVMARTGLSIVDMDVIEVNEAFVVQAIATLRALGVRDDAPHVNPNGRDCHGLPARHVGRLPSLERCLPTRAHGRP